MGKMEKGQIGPKMKLLNDRQRDFVLAMITQGTSNYTAAARTAGYEDSENIRRQATRLAHDPKILAAIKEESEKRMQAAVGVAANVLVEIAQNETHKDQLKAATALLNRGGLHEMTEQRITHDVSSDAKSLLARFAVLAGALGVDPARILGRAGLALPVPEPIEGEFVVVDDTSPGNVAEMEPVGPRMEPALPDWML
jgi:hypothetical protein